MTSLRWTDEYEYLSWMNRDMNWMKEIDIKTKRDRYVCILLAEIMELAQNYNFVAEGILVWRVT